MVSIEEKYSVLIEHCNTHYCSECCLFKTCKDWNDARELGCVEYNVPNIEADYEALQRAIELGENEPASVTKETVNHPSHYNRGIEAIDYIESHNMNFNMGNVIKYVTRAKHKGTELEDLRKASWYLNREIVNLEKEGKK